MAGPAPASRSLALAPRRSWSERTWGLWFVAPALGIVGALMLAPIFGAIGMSFQRRLPIFGIGEFVGLRNYVLLAQDDRFWAACRTTLYFTGVAVVAELALGLGMALLLHHVGTRLSQAKRGLWQGALYAVVLIPWTVPTVVSARIWEWLYQPEYGLLNYLLTVTGIARAPINWLGDPDWVIHAAIIMDVWKTAPFAALLLLAGLKAIPRDLYQAAVVDGAGRWAIFSRITLPLLLPVILIVLVFRTMDTMRVFDAVYVLTGGGPGNSTETLSIYAYKTLFQTLQFGYGSAQAVVMFALVMLMTAAYLLMLRQHMKELAR